MEQRRVSPVFLAGSVCLDFANTVWWRMRPDPVETLPDYAELVRWGEMAGLLDAMRAGLLRGRAAAAPDRANRALNRTLAFREAINRLFALEPGQTFDSDALRTVSEMLAAGMVHAKVLERTGQLDWTWPPDETSLDLPGWMLAREAVEMLTGSRAHLVHRCPGEGCGWLFLDGTKNHSRRWCDISTCGNRAHVKAHYRRTHAT